MKKDIEKLKIKQVSEHCASFFLYFERKILPSLLYVKYIINFFNYFNKKNVYIGGRQIIFSLIFGAPLHFIMRFVL